MSKWNAYLNNGKRVLEAYHGKQPLSVWLKDFFRQHKQMGSRDRKIISEEVYKAYRLGHSLQPAPGENRLLTGLFLCNTSFNELLDHFKPEWNSKIHLSLNDKIIFLKGEVPELLPDKVFPWTNELSGDIEHTPFNQSHLIQPNLFLRMRPAHHENIKQKLIQAGVSYTVVDNDCLELPNATSVDKILAIDKEVVIQDYSSQRVGTYFKSIINEDLHHAMSVWDCCAGSGGKSIMVYDIDQNIRLTVSDSRSSIIENLKARFSRAGIAGYQYFVADLALPATTLPHNEYDCIIADVPCSGSGTWSRTPEQLCFFKPQQIEYYSNLQKTIVSRAVQKLKEKGSFVYITCSVFKRENEDVVEFIQSNLRLRLQEMQLLQGYERKADSMFVAVFKKQ